MDKDDMISNAIVLAILLYILLFIDTWYWHYTKFTANRIRNSIIGLVYKKI